MASTSNISWMAYVYPGPKNNFLGDVARYKGAYVYGADAEFNCRGVGKSTGNTKCTFSGASANSYIGFSGGNNGTAANKNFDTIAKAYKDSGKDVWMVVDGKVGSKYIPSWVPLTAQELTDLARAAADNACFDTNVVGLAVDFEPYAKTFDTSVSNGIFYTQLDQFIKNCNKKWAVFAGGSSWIQPNWDSLGTSGYLLLSAYDIGTTCPSAAVYQAELTNLLNVVVQNAIQYNKVDRIIPVFSGGGSTQLNDGCAPTTMQQYATAAVLAVKNSKFAPYLKIGAIYPYRNGGLSPATPPPAVVQELMTL